MNRVFCNGAEAAADDLAAALTNYGHFTSMQVRGGAVQGLELHLQRLRQGTAELFAGTLDDARVRAWMRQALDACGMADASLRVTVFSRRFDFRRPLQPLAVDVLVSVSGPVQASPQPLSLGSVAYRRELPHLKHVGTFPLFQHRRQALLAGFDDALFVTADGLVSEGATWNIGFWDGQDVTWPRAPALRGTTERLLMDGLQAREQGQVQREVALAELRDFSGAVTCNASGLWPVARIDGAGFPESGPFRQRLLAVLQERPWEPL